MTHAFVLRSPVAHAHIKRIDAAAARRMPGVLFVATGEDVRADGLGDVPCMVPLVNREGTPRHDTPRPVLALGKVRHVGQPVALVVAATLTAARDAAEAIDVEYEPLPAITEAKDAISPGAPQLFDHIPSNIVFAPCIPAGKLEQKPRTAVSFRTASGERGRAARRDETQFLRARILEQTMP
jgi:carbon-monoxide dehydrogenase large subunit